MLRRAWTRRDFLTASAGVGALLAATTVPAGQWLAGLLARTATRAGTSLAELKRRAPKARFWISTKTAAKVSDCLGCHQPDELPGEAKHDHETTTAKCQLCARNCMIDDGERGMCRARMTAPPPTSRTSRPASAAPSPAAASIPFSPTGTGRP